MVVIEKRFFGRNFAQGGAVKKSFGFYIFMGLVVVMIGVLVWSLWPAEDVVSAVDEPVPHGGQTETTKALPVQDETPKRAGSSLEVEAKHAPDDQMFLDSIEDGFLPTQDIGEQGSKGGVLTTKYPMNYRPSKYERIENSPLYIFTDDMIWKSGADTYTVKRDAIADQAYHYQEAAVALSISPRLKDGQINGFRFVEIPDNTLFAKLGMTSGDVLISINDTIPDMEPMALTFMTMVAGRQGRSTIVVEHKGQKRTIQIQAAE